MKKILNIKKKYMSNPSKVLTLANVISMLRAAAAIPIIYTLNYPEMRTITAGIVILAILILILVLALLKVALTRVMVGVIRVIHQ